MTKLQSCLKDFSAVRMVKRFFIVLSACFSALFSTVSLPCISEDINVVHAAVLSKAECVVEVESGRILFTQNGKEKLPMASTTKILTAIIAIEDLDAGMQITVPEKAVGIEGSSIYLVKGEKMTVRDLLYGLMLRSGNDCAAALAILHSGSVEKFAVCMNERAEQIGAHDSSFLNPHGLPQEGHFTTAEDLAKIAAYALQNPVFSQIVSADRYVIPDGGCGYARDLRNKNKMLYEYDGADGVKTGFTKEAGRCLVTSATRNGMRIVSVVLNSPDMYGRSAELLDNAFRGFSKTLLFDKNNYSAELKTDAKEKTCKCGCSESFAYPLTEEEKQFVKIREVLPSEICLPVKKGEPVGEIQIYLKNQLLFSQKIVSIESKEKSYLDIIREIAKRNCSGKVCGSINIWRNAALQAAGRATS